jgi:hypothetical protein
MLIPLVQRRTRSACLSGGLFSLDRENVAWLIQEIIEVWLGIFDIDIGESVIKR